MFFSGKDTSKVEDIIEKNIYRGKKINEKNTCDWGRWFYRVSFMQKIVDIE